MTVVIVGSLNHLLGPESRAGVAGGTLHDSCKLRHSKQGSAASNDTAHGWYSKPAPNTTALDDRECLGAAQFRVWYFGILIPNPRNAGIKAGTSSFSSSSALAGWTGIVVWMSCEARDTGKQ